ncbi:MAG: OadG family protein [Clostridia bacterium]|nr:OadG family protein [Clostridia bacterium]MBQ2237199.1 OadG family protein [Clostridia bacterium]
MSNSFVVLMGVGVVFVGLISIVIITSIMSALCRTTEKNPEADTAAVAPAPVNQVIENKQEIIAAVSAVIAEELGTDISAIRIHSFKKI